MQKNEKQTKKIKNVADATLTQIIPTKTSKIIDLNKIKQGSWIESQYAREKSMFKFMGQLTDKNEEEAVKVKFLKRSKTGH